MIILEDKNLYRVGIDIGSTTIKIVLTNNDGEIIFSDYQRHNADILNAFLSAFNRVKAEFGDIMINIIITGSAGMGISEKFNIPFIQEVVASAEVINQKYPEIKTLIDIGGEDAKMIFFTKNKTPDIRMNGSCAGGTGAFIDQMASLLGITPADINELASNYSNIYPIASRCGVFTKTDIQNLIAKNVKKEDIAASIFNAVAMQTITSLARGYEVTPKVFFCGGPFSFLPELKKIFARQLNLADEDCIVSPNAQFIPAWGCAISDDSQFTDEKPKLEIYLSEFISLIQNSNNSEQILSERLEPLFLNKHEYELWKSKKDKYRISQLKISDVNENDTFFMGIDSGSTTTKIIITDSKEQIVFSYYTKNNGRPLESIQAGLNAFNYEAQKVGKTIRISKSAVTGYGEDLVKAAYNLDYGIVETIAHYTAAKKFQENVSFILDIGGQDMKAIFVENDTINKLEINEACSSGCGSFIEGFANSLNYKVSDFAEEACSAQNPCDLGTRCTVFMNSKVKQFLREGANVSDIAAGLAYSVIKNCLYKVLKIRNVSELGDNIVVQGGTFRNRSVIRALELLTKKEVICSNIPELMGAYGSAIYALREFSKEKEHINCKTSNITTYLPKLMEYSTEQFNCRGCENLCLISKLTFDSGKSFVTGNKCEKVYTNKGKGATRGDNHYNFKLKQLNSYIKPKNKENKLSIGIPRALNMYENFPFWSELLTGCGINVVVSRPSTFKQYEKGIGSVMSDNICFPAKLVHGHIHDLIEMKVDRIFYPFVVYEKKEHDSVANSYNCPIVSGYGEVLKSSIDTAKQFNIPLDSPTINFDDEKLLKKACYSYLKSFHVPQLVFEKAFENALKAFEMYKSSLKQNCKRIFEKAVIENRTVILVASRPYHTDQLIQHKLTDMIADFGVDVISDDLIRLDDYSQFSELNTVSQWTYTNRILRAAQLVGQSESDIHFIEITSFGCGPDAFIIDEVGEILKSYGKNFTLLKVDDVSNIGSLKLRVRSLLESLKYQNATNSNQYQLKQTPNYTASDKQKTILAPFFSEFYSPFVATFFGMMGYKLVNLPPSDEISIEYGLKYANNEICYPATLVIGDIIRALKSGEYDLNDIVIGMTQTGGQCRATNYIMLIKKALLAAGFNNIPVISIAFAEGLQNQQEFKLEYKSIMNTAIYAALYADSISKMYYSAAAHEFEKGQAIKLRDKYINDVQPILVQKNHKKILELLRQATDDFNAIIDVTKNPPKIGIVGEIYVKYNSIGHKHVVKWLVEQNVEVVMPPIISFFIQYFVNRKVDVSHNLAHKKIFGNFLPDMLQQLVNRVIRKTSKIAANYKLWIPFGDIYEEAKEAEKIISLATQFGEGWLIPAEISNFNKHGVQNVVSLQPFGCIANHIISKGIEKKIKMQYPNMNLLFLDFDSGVSDVNVHNRLHFMIKNAKEHSYDKLVGA